MLIGKNKPTLCASLKNSKRFVIDRKALSPIFSTLIILAVVTVLFIPVFIWATGTTSQTTDSWSLSGKIATERIVVEEVSLKSGQTSCVTYVRNIGTTAVTVSNVIISSSSGVLYPYSGGQVASSPSSVVQGDLITVTVSTLGFAPAEGDVYTVKVSTTLGVSDSLQVVA